MICRFAPGDMPARIAARCCALSQRPPETQGETIRSALTSLACKYRLVLERLVRVISDLLRADIRRGAAAPGLKIDQSHSVVPKIEAITRIAQARGALHSIG
jgi:hypothetical protein